MLEERKELEVVSGDGSNLDISPVYEDIKTTRPKPKDSNPKNIIIPKEHKKEDKSEE